MLSRNEKLSRGAPPPYYEILFKQVQKYLAEIETAHGRPYNPFEATIYYGPDDNFHDAQTMVSENRDEEMVDAKPSTYKLSPVVGNLSLNDSVAYIKQYPAKNCPSTQSLTAFGIYITLAAYDIETYAEYLAALSAAEFNVQNMLGGVAVMFSDLNVIPNPLQDPGGEASLHSEHSSPAESLESLPIKEVIERMPLASQQWRSEGAPHIVQKADEIPAVHTIARPPSTRFKDYTKLHAPTSTTGSATSSRKRRIHPAKQQIGKHVADFAVSNTGRQIPTTTKKAASGKETTRSASRTRHDQLNLTLMANQLPHVRIQPLSQPLSCNHNWEQLDVPIHMPPYHLKMSHPITGQPSARSSYAASSISRTTEHPTRMRIPPLA